MTWTKKNAFWGSVAAMPHAVWCVLFIIAPLCFILYYAFTDANGSFTTLINGTWGQYPCADPNSNAAEECKRLRSQLERLEKVYRESKEEHSRAIGYFKDLLSESKRALKSHKIAVLILGSILVALACVEFAIPNMGWIRW